MTSQTAPPKIVQVPMPELLLKEVTRRAKGRRQSRAAFIRQALEHYLADLHEREMDEAHSEGYRRIPEEVSIGETGAKLAVMVFSVEAATRFALGME
jgi:Arc/MetJ-type ribon-helix-helix transcriptional regulator